MPSKECSQVSLSLKLFQMPMNLFSVIMKSVFLQISSYSLRMRSLRTLSTWILFTRLLNLLHFLQLNLSYLFSHPPKQMLELWLMNLCDSVWVQQLRFWALRPSRFFVPCVLLDYFSSQLSELIIRATPRKPLIYRWQVPRWLFLARFGGLGELESWSFLQRRQMLSGATAALTWYAGGRGSLIWRPSGIVVI